MVKKCDPNLVKKEDLIVSIVQHNNQSNAKNLKSLTKNEIVWKAYQLGLIDETKRDASFVRKESTIPCYLWTHVTDETVRSKIESYVQAYSMLYTRGTYLANLAILSIPIPDFNVNSFPEGQIPIPTFLKKYEDTKKCFYPERWMERKTNTEDINPLIQETFQTHRNVLDPLLPTEHVLSNCGWDNALNHMGSMFLGNLKVQVIVPLKARIIKFITARSFSQGTTKTAVINLVLNQARPTTQVSIDDYEWIHTFRKFLGFGLTTRFNDVAELQELNDLTWTLHVWLQTVFQEDGFSRAPVSPISRKYAYLDEKIVKSLLDTKTKKKMLELTQNHPGSNLQKLLGLTSVCFNKRRQKLRKQLQKRYKNNANKKQLRKKWMKIGHSCLSSKAEIASISTDGVGLRLSVKYKPTEPFVSTHPDDRTIPDDAYQIGFDGGRVNLGTTADQLGNVNLVKRSQFYKTQRDKKAKRWERQRMKATAWGQAIAEMSEAGGFKNTKLSTWEATLGVVANHINVLKNEQLVSKERALMKMRRFRWKKSFLDRGWKNVLKPGIDKERKRHIALGIGDGDFPCTGKGEQAVPTKGIYISLWRVVRMLGIRQLVHEVSIPEYNTTKCCHRCGHVMEPVYTPQGDELLRYRLCRNCSTETIGKRRNRDVNASKNMLKLLACKIFGLPRPDCLAIPWERNINGGLPLE